MKASEIQEPLAMHYRVNAFISCAKRDCLRFMVIAIQIDHRPFHT